MTINLFDEPTDAQNANASTPTSNNPLEDLVGEGKKFKTPEDLARGKIESDQFIERLKGELAGLRTELNTRQTLEQLMDKMAGNNGSTDNSNQMANNQTPVNSGDGAQNKSFTEDDVMRIVESKLSEAEKTRVQNANLSLVRNALSEKYGNDYVSKLKESASALGVDENFLQDMAKNQPKAFLKLIDTGTTTNQQSSNNSLFAPPTGQNLRSDNFKPTAGRTKGYYDQLKAKNPGEYWSPAIQNQMHKDALSLGEKFFDTP